MGKMVVRHIMSTVQICLIVVKTLKGIFLLCTYQKNGLSVTFFVSSCI